MINYSTDPRFQVLYEKGDVKIYFLKDESIAELHKSREAELHIQNIYSNSGATAAYLGALADEMIKALEDDPKNEKLRQMQLSAWNEVKFRTKSPVDSLCSVRMGAICSFMDGEPQDCNGAWIEKKVRMAQEDPDLYNFFMVWGQNNTPSYFRHSDFLNDPTSSQRRQEMIMSFKQYRAK